MKVRGREGKGQKRCHVLYQSAHRPDGRSGGLCGAGLLPIKRLKLGVHFGEGPVCCQGSSCAGTAS